MIKNTVFVLKAQPKYRRASKVVVETYTLKTAVVGMGKNHNFYGKQSTAPHKLSMTAEPYYFPQYKLW
ncbi:MAG: hypothetical protein J6K43_08075, partial [Lachnospiraceae bacterium]|nr:hypothetical protein [Lachnospiraceae bacterium]